MELISKLKEKLTDNIATAVLALIALLPGFFAFLLDLLGLSEKFAKLDSLLLTKTVLYLSMICVLLIAYIVYKRPKYKIRFYAKWDKKGNPFCPSCETPVYETTRDHSSILTCPNKKCGSNIRIQHENGKDIYIEEARLMITKDIKLDEIRKSDS